MRIDWVDSKGTLRYASWKSTTDMSKQPDLTMIGGKYNEEKDIIKYDGPADTYVTCKPGEMAIFFPQDGHMPQLCVDEPEMVKRVVVKVEVG